MNNNMIKKGSLDEITLDTMKEGIYLALICGTTSTAMLGYSGDTVVLHNTDNLSNSRQSQASIRMHSGTLELLLTDVHGSFITYLKWHVDLPLEHIAHEMYNAFLNYKPYMGRSMTSSGMRNLDKVDFDMPQTYMAGFNYLKAIQQKRGITFTVPEKKHTPTINKWIKRWIKLSK